jgi:AcrR family transcriptional regulator
MASPRADPSATGLRERKKLATRQALSLAALRLAVERGFENVLIEDIAAEVGVSPRTFNNYFSSKHEAICGLAVDRARRIGEELRKRPATEPLWDAITHAVLQQYESVNEKADKEWKTGVRLVTSAPALRGEYLKAQSVVQDALAGAIAERTGTDVERNMLPRILAGAVTAASDVAIDHWLHAGKQAELVSLIRQALRQLADGLPLPKSARSRAIKHRKKNK